MGGRRTAAGFTLVEVLVAIAVLALMAAMAWQGVDTLVRARGQSQQRLEASLRLGSVLAQWEQDLAALQDSQVVPALRFDGATLRLTRRAPEGLQVVAWSLAPGSPAWRRWAGPAVTERSALQEQWLRSQHLPSPTAGQIDALPGAVAWQIYFYRGNAWSNAQSSAELAGPATAASAASAPAREALPSGVRLVLNFGPGGQLTRDLALAPQAP